MRIGRRGRRLRPNHVPRVSALAPSEGRVIDRVGASAVVLDFDLLIVLVCRQVVHSSPTVHPPQLCRWPRLQSRGDLLWMESNYYPAWLGIVSVLARISFARSCEMNGSDGADPT